MAHKHRHLRKAAILVASLDPAHAAELVREMSPSQAESLRQAVENLGPIDPDEQNEVLEEFFRIGPLVPDKQPSGLELDSRLGEQLAASLPGNSSDNSGPVAFRCLHEAPIETLVPFLEHEHPQTIAVVISNLAPDRAAAILAGLSADLQVEIARRLMDFEETDPEILRELEQGLEIWLSEQARDSRRRQAGKTALANILGAVNPLTKQHILSHLNPQDRPAPQPPAPAARSCFSFAELERLDSASLTVVLHHAESELIVLALAGASPSFAERAFDLFPAHESAAFRRALGKLGPTRLSDVEQAQQALAELARDLELRGEIALPVRRQLSVAV